MLDTDYEVDLVNARWRPLSGSAIITNPDDVTIGYTRDACSIPRIIPAGTATLASVRMVGVAGVAGDPISYYFEKARVLAADTVVLKPNPEGNVLQRIPLKIEPLKRSGYAVWVATGTPVVPT